MNEVRAPRAATRMRRRVAACLALVVALLAVPPAARGEQTTVLAIDGQATVASIDIGGAGLVLPAGIARADIAGTHAQASSNLVDYALVATVLGAIFGAGTTFPGPVKATSDGPADAARTTTIPGAGSLPAVAAGPASAGLSSEEAHVRPGPTAQALTQLAPVQLDQVASIAGGASSTDIGAAAADARSSIAELRLSSAIVLRDLSWQADAGPGGPPTASFHIGGLDLAGRRVPVGADGVDTDALSTLLGLFGVHLDAPVITVDGGRATVSPLVVRYGDSPLAHVIGPLYTAVSPALIQAFTQIQGHAADAGYVLYASTIVLASLAGLGELRIEVGGATVSYEQRAFDAGGGGAATGGDEAVPPALPSTTGAAHAAEPSAMAPVAGAPIGTGAVLGAPATSFSAARAAGRRLADRVPDAVVLALVIAGLLGAGLLGWSRRGKGRSAAGGVHP